jgi:anti-anti-sigma regulatory factor/anti-sigma regulatory factor (Ser/Thr protein kinase)
MKCSSTWEPPVAVVRAQGALDLASAPMLRAALLKCLANQPDGILLDAAELTVVDDIHLTALMVAARHAAAWPAIPILMCAASPEVAAATRRLGLDRHIIVRPSLLDGRRRVAERVPPPRITDSLAPVAESASRARAIVRQTCARWRLDSIAPSAELLAAELVANAVRHAGTRIELSVSRSARGLSIAVRDYASAPTRLVGPAGEAEPGGRGLLLVEALATHWGCTATRDGKVTWATLATGPHKAGR